jgi:hypothetical protein
MILTELQAEVVSLTKRPDLNSTSILTAIKAATLKLHQLDYFTKDILETPISFATADYYQSLSYMTNFPRWRSLAWLRKLDSTLLPYDPPLKRLDPRAVLDQFGVQKNNVYYEAGRVMQINTLEQVQYFLLAIYQNPDVATGTYTSWIADSYPYAIIFDAAATVFKSVGFGDMEASMRLLCAEQKQLILNSNITEDGS